MVCGWICAVRVYERHGKSGYCTQVLHSFSNAILLFSNLTMPSVLKYPGPQALLSILP
jgi:hypothetical protein